MLSASPFIVVVNKAAAYLWHPQLLPAGLVAEQPSQAAALGQMLLSQPKRPVMVVADDPNQDIILDVIPNLKRHDRAALITRRITNHCTGALFATVIAATKSGSQEQIMIWQLAADSPTAAWLQWLAALPNPPAATYSSTELLTTLLATGIKNSKSKPDHSNQHEWLHVLFATHDGWRHMVLRDGQPLLSRVIIIHSDTPKLLLQALQAGRDYAARYGWRNHHDEQMLLLVSATQRQQLQPHVPPEILILTPHEAVTTLKLPIDGGADIQQLLAKAATYYQRHYRLPPSLSRHYLPPIRRFIRHTMIARWGWRLAISLAIFAIAVFAIGLQYQNTARQALAAATAETATLQAMQRQQQQTMGSFAQSRRRARQARLLQNQFHNRTPWRMLTALGQMQDSMRLTRLVWQVKDGHEMASFTLQIMPDTDFIETQTNSATAKDSWQQTGLQQFDSYLARLRQDLPTSTIKTLQAPFALAAAQSFVDPALLQNTATATLSPTTAILEIMLP